MCGDGICDGDAGEDHTNCPTDCSGAVAVCGDYICDQAAGENPDTCAEDCGDSYVAVCGDWTCDPDAGEDSVSCPDDCGGWEAEGEGSSELTSAAASPVDSSAGALTVGPLSPAELSEPGPVSALIRWMLTYSGAGPLGVN
jgi:hypothetical protein